MFIVACLVVWVVVWSQLVCLGLCCSVSVCCFLVAWCFLGFVGLLVWCFGFGLVICCAMLLVPGGCVVLVFVCLGWVVVWVVGLLLFDFRVVGLVLLLCGVFLLLMLLVSGSGGFNSVDFVILICIARLGSIYGGWFVVLLVWLFPWFVMCGCYLVAACIC